jgi:hypothetical protein
MTLTGSLSMMSGRLTIIAPNLLFISSPLGPLVVFVGNMGTDSEGLF